MSRVGWLKSSTASSRASSPAASTSGGGGGGRRSTSVAPGPGSGSSSAAGPSSSSSLLSSKAAAVVNLYPQMTRPDTSRFEDEKKRISEFKVRRWLDLLRAGLSTGQDGNLSLTEHGPPSRSDRRRTTSVPSAGRTGT
jgi:hypothetical protein